MKLYGPSYANIGAVYTLEPLTRAQNNPYTNDATLVGGVICFVWN